MLVFFQSAIFQFASPGEFCHPEPSPATNLMHEPVSVLSLWQNPSTMRSWLNNPRIDPFSLWQHGSIAFLRKVTFYSDNPWRYHARNTSISSQCLCKSRFGFLSLPNIRHKTAKSLPAQFGMKNMNLRPPPACHWSTNPFTGTSRLIPKSNTNRKSFQKGEFWIGQADKHRKRDVNTKGLRFTCDLGLSVFGLSRRYLYLNIPLRSLPQSMLVSVYGVCFEKKNKNIGCGSSGWCGIELSRGKL